MPRIDERLKLGATVHSKVTAVTHMSEAKRLFGSLAKSHCVNGVVIHVGKKSSTSKSGVERQMTVLQVEFDVLNEHKKTVILPLGQVKAGPFQDSQLTGAHPTRVGGRSGSPTRETVNTSTGNQSAGTGFPGSSTEDPS